MSKTLNYIGQLRLYSLIDLIVFLTALTRDTSTITAGTLLWISFILYLEGQHKDPLRLPIHPQLWIIFTLPSFFVFPPYIPVLFFIFSFLYTKKKIHRFFGTTSPIWRALQNAVLALSFNSWLSLTSFCITALRNLIGDFRDIEQDKKTTTTIPIALGFQKNQKWAYFGHLLFVIASTIFWASHSQFIIPIPLLVFLNCLQILSYPLTPRLTNPKFFQNQNAELSRPVTNR